jgi:hypothetical protein
MAQDIMLVSFPFLLMEVLVTEMNRVSARLRV